MMDSDGYMRKKNNVSARELISHTLHLGCLISIDRKATAHKFVSGTHTVKGMVQQMRVVTVPLFQESTQRNPQPS